MSATEARGKFRSMFAREQPPDPYRRAPASNVDLPLIVDRDRGGVPAQVLLGHARIVFRSG